MCKCNFLRKGSIVSFNFSEESENLQKLITIGLGNPMVSLSMKQTSACNTHMFAVLVMHFFVGFKVWIFLVLVVLEMGHKYIATQLFCAVGYRSYFLHWLSARGSFQYLVLPLGDGRRQGWEIWSKAAKVATLLAAPIKAYLEGELKSLIQLKFGDYQWISIIHELLVSHGYQWLNVPCTFKWFLLIKWKGSNS